MQFGTPARLEDTDLVIDATELRRIVLEDDAVVSVDFEIVRPGEHCRAGPIFDVIEPRAKEPGSGVDFPGILGAAAYCGNGNDTCLKRSGGIGTRRNLTRPYEKRHRARSRNERRSG